MTTNDYKLRRVALEILIEQAQAVLASLDAQTHTIDAQHDPDAAHLLESNIDNEDAAGLEDTAKTSHMGPFNYLLLPEHLRSGVKRWIEQGIRPGSFLQAVMRKDLVDAVTHADEVSLAHLREIVQFFQHEAPRPCWGSEQWIQSWEAAINKAAKAATT